MAIVSVNTLFAGQSLRASNTERVHEFAWLVEVDDPSDNQMTVYNHMKFWLGQPVVGLGNTQDVEALCENLSIDRVPDSRLYWIVSGSFEVPTLDVPTVPEGADPDDPTQWLDEVDVGAVEYSKPLEKATFKTELGKIGRPFDFEGTPCNAAGEIFDPALEVDAAYTVYRVTKYMNAYNADLYDTYANVTNDDIFVLRKPGLVKTFYRNSAKMKPITGSLNWHTPKEGPLIPYWRVNFEIHHKNDWWFEVPNLGTMRRALYDDPNGKGGRVIEPPPPGVPAMQRIVDKDDNPITSPVMLDLDGQPVDPPGSQEIYLQFEGYPRKPFSVLGI